MKRPWLARAGATCPAGKIARREVRVAARRRVGRDRPGFTVVELLVVLAILALLTAVVLPLVMSLLERRSRVQCVDQLWHLRDALQAYASDHGGVFPRVRYDAERRPVGYTAYTGPDDADPFTQTNPATDVEPSDVTASLWLLVRGNYVTDLSLFVCPSTSDRADRLTDLGGRPVAASARGNFRGRNHLSYSYAHPFGPAPGYGLHRNLPAEFAILADMNPGIGDGFDVTAPAYDAAPLGLAVANSRNHGGAGQNVLYADGTVWFKRTPYAGVGQTRSPGMPPRGDGDHIFTALETRPLWVVETPTINARGHFGRHYSPSRADDSYLVPAASD